MVDEIVSSLEAYSVHSTAIAEYLFAHEENLDDIPMLDMIDMGTDQAADKIGFQECA